MPDSALRPIRPRIAFLDARHASWYGAQKSLATLLGAIRDDVDVHFLTTADGVLATEMAGRGHRVKVLPLGAGANVFGGQVLRGGLRALLSQATDVVRYWHAARRWLKRNQIEVVYANDLRALLLLGPPARSLGLPVLWYVREDRRHPVFSGLGARLATRIILIARAVGERAFSPGTLRATGDRFRTVYTGFDCTQYAPQQGDRERIRSTWGIGESEKVVGLVGSITPRKGQDVLIAALPELREAVGDLHVVMVGDPSAGGEDWAEEQRRSVRELGFSHRVHWVGYHDPIREAYAGLDALVLPSSSEGLPRTVIEGLAAGLPVVTYDSGGTREILTDRDLGSMPERGDPRHLANHLARALTDPDLHTPEVRRKRRVSVTERFTIERFRQGFLEVVREVHPEFGRDVLHRDVPEVHHTVEML